MRSFTLLEIDDEDLFDEIVVAKREPTKGHLWSVRDTAFEAYQAYEVAAPEVGFLAPVALQVEQREALTHAYVVPTQPLDRFRDRVLYQVDAAMCPFCNISEAWTLDHYLPKEDYPIFSVYSRNLVPSCGKCNNLKRRSVVDEQTDVRRFVHPYFDVVPEERFLAVAVDLSATSLGLTYRVEHIAGMPLAAYQQLESHFRLLELSDRYRLRSLITLRGQVLALQLRYGAGGNAEKVKTSLIEQADSLAHEFGVNHWGAVLYSALGANHEFCDGGFRVIGNYGGA